MNSSNRIPHPRLVEDDPEFDIEGQLARVVSGVKASDPYPLPSYVEHAENVPTLGKLSAQSVIKEFEEAAMEIEAMGKELGIKARVAEEMFIELSTNLNKELKEIVAAFREDGKRVFEEVENCSAKMDRVRKKCEELRLEIIAS